MPTGPGPTGGPPFPGPTYAQDPAAFRQEAAALDAKYPGTGVGARFLALAQVNPNVSMSRIVVATLLFLGLGQGVGSAVGSAVGGIGNVAQSTANALPTSPLTGINSIGDFFQRLSQANTWIRVGEVIAGLFVLYLGVSALTRGTTAGEVAHKTASTAKKVLK